MSNASDFIIENGKLLRYTGSEECVQIPETVNVIGAEAFHHKHRECFKVPFKGTAEAWNKLTRNQVKRVEIPASVLIIERYAFCIIFRNHITSVIQRIEFTAKAIWVSNIFKHAHIIQYIIFNCLVMRKNHSFCQSKPGNKPLIFRVHCLAIKLRLCIDDISAVHCSRADSDNNSVIAIQFLFQTNFLKEGILRGDMPS